MNFNDLRSVYEYATADGRHSIQSHYREIKNEVEGTNIGAYLDGLWILLVNLNGNWCIVWT